MKSLCILQIQLLPSFSGKYALMDSLTQTQNQKAWLVSPQLSSTGDGCLEFWCESKLENDPASLIIQVRFILGIICMEAEWAL